MARYVRGVDNGAGRSQYASLFVYYEDMLEAHTHRMLMGGWAADGNDGGRDEGLRGTGTNITMETESTGGAETMPMTVP